MPGHPPRAPHQQLHGGLAAGGRRLPLREPAHRAFPKAAESWDLDRIVADYASAAVRCKEGGLDGIELQSYGHFFDGFLSPATNHRDDEYGGDLEHRMAFPAV